MENDSLFLLVANSIDENGDLPSDFSLPKQDDQPIMFADGAMDGIYIYHMGHSPLSEEDADKLGSLLRKAAEGREEEAEEGFAEFCKDNRALSIIDDVQKYIVNHTSELSADNMYKFAVNMMMASNHIECVKIGMCILELFDTEENETLADAIRAIGVSDEFTIFSVFLMRNWENGAMEVLELAKHVHGWGRIHCMDFIEPENEEIKNWILENGVDNEVVPAYSGMVAYEKADVPGVLVKNKLSKDEMHGILKIVSAMLDEGPVNGISNLDEPETFLCSVVKRAAAMLPLEVADYEVINEIDEWQEENGEDDNSELDALMDEIFGNERVRKQVVEAVQEGKAIHLAATIGIPYKEEVYKVMLNNFDNKYYLSGHIASDEEYTDKVIKLFEDNVDLKLVASGSASEMGLGGDYEEHRKLDHIIYELRPFVNKGEKLLEAALQSPVIRNRNMAVKTLQCWVEEKQSPLVEVNPMLHQLLIDIKDKEVEEHLVKGFAVLISGCYEFSNAEEDEDDE